jgi:biopolymer transport protein ExbD/biopolymer transport protein TolR
MSNKRDTFSEINITPLTDIFLVLLIIMMVIAPILDQQGLNLTVPENVLAEKQNKEIKIMTVVVNADDSYSLDGENVPVKQLQNTIKSKLSSYPDGLMIQAQGESSHGALVKLMDSARAAGVKSISVEQI